MSDLPILLQPEERCTACGWPGAMMFAVRPCLAAATRGEDSGIKGCMTEDEKLDNLSDPDWKRAISVATERLRIEGRWAREAGRTLQSSPYAKDSIAAGLWQAGWTARDAEHARAFAP